MTVDSKLVGSKTKVGLRHLSNRAIVNLFIWPTLALLIAMNVFPLFYSLYLGFTNYTAIAGKAPVWVAFQNFSNILNDKNLWQAFRHDRALCLVVGQFANPGGFWLGHACT